MRGTIVNTAAPAQNSAANATVCDVAGNKTDDESGTSLFSKMYIIEKHLHSVCKVAPTLAAGIDVTATTGVGAWTLGAFSADIIAAGAVADPYDIHFISIEALDTATTYEIVLYYGAGDTEAGRVRVVKTGVNEATNNTSFISPIIPGGSRLRAKIATPGDNGEIARVSVFYHTY